MEKTGNSTTTAGRDPGRSTSFRHADHAFSPVDDPLGSLGWARPAYRLPVPREVRFHLQGDESPWIILAPHGMVRKCYAFIYLPRNISSRSARVAPKKDRLLPN